MEKNKRKNTVMVLLILLLGITVGFAALATTLKINGTTSIGKNTWSIYWDNVNVIHGSTTPQIVNGDDSSINTKVIWSTSLASPGDYFEFNVDAVNNGTVDAMITDIISTVTDGSDEVTLPSYVKYTVTYADGKKIKKNHLLPKKSGDTPTKETYKVKVLYDADAMTREDVNNMPEGGLYYEFSYEVTYGQATDDARDRLVSPYQINRQVPGTITKGDEACTGTTIGDGECFYIMNVRDDGTALLLPKYNLNISEATETEIRQSTSSDDSDTIRFSQTNYYDNHYGLYEKDKYNKYYVYNELTFAYEYIEKYKDYLTSLGLDILDARLLKYEEMIDDFGCSDTGFSGNVCDPISQYLGKSFWIGSVYNYDSLYRAGGSALWINMYNNSSGNGVRPVIIIDADDL